MSHRNGLTFAPDTNLFLGDDGAEYVECAFETANPIMIRVDTDTWAVRFNGAIQRIDWSQPRLPDSIKEAFRTATTYKLAKSAPSYLAVVHRMLRSLALIWDKHAPENAIGFACLEASHLIALATNIPRHDASAFRELYRKQ